MKSNRQKPHTTAKKKRHILNLSKNNLPFMPHVDCNIRVRQLRHDETCNEVGTYTLEIPYYISFKQWETETRGVLLGFLCCQIGSITTSLSSYIRLSLRRISATLLRTKQTWESAPYCSQFQGFPITAECSQYQGFPISPEYSQFEWSPVKTECFQFQRFPITSECFQFPGFLITPESSKFEDGPNSARLTGLDIWVLQSR
jgi:hypothetical protein